MDADIASATTELDLSKIRTQLMRDRETALLGLIGWLRDEYLKLPDMPLEHRRELAVAIAPKYFTTSTATAPESILLDATNDAARFKAALDEACKAVG